jgi:hypothetical protein
VSRRINITTPSPELQRGVDDQPVGQRPQLQAPKRAAIFAVYLWAKQQSVPFDLQSISILFGIPKSTASDVFSSGTCRRLQNSGDVDSRPALRQLTRSDTNAIATYLDEATFEEKSFLWQELAEKSGVVKEYRHEKGQKNTVEQ